MTDQLGMQERFELAEAQCGFMPLITIVGRLSRPCSQETCELLGANVKRLLSTFPILNATIADRCTRQPRWQKMDEPFDANLILHYEKPAVISVAEVIAHEKQKGMQFDLERGPLWRVGVYDDQISDREGYFLAVTLTHILTDGMGLQQIFWHLLQPLDAVQAGHTLTQIQRAEDNIDFTPRFLQAAASVIHEILTTVLPQSLHKYIGITSYWPAPGPLSTSQPETKEKFLIVDFGALSGALIPGLRLFGKLSGSGSVQSLLHTAGIVALIATSEHHSTSLNALKTETPISIRNESLGHPPLGGNFTALGALQAGVEQLYSQTIFESTQQYHNYIHSPKGRSDSLSNVGMLRLIPDLPSLSFWSTPSYKLEGAKVIPCPTGWESFLTQQSRKSSPYRCSFAVSNLGVLRYDENMQSVCGSVEDIWFRQSPMPFGAAIYIDVVSSEPISRQNKTAPVLGVIISWLEGAVRREFVETFSKAFVAALSAFSSAGNLGASQAHLVKDRTIGDVVKELRGSQVLG